MPVQPEISRDVPRETSDYVEGVGRRDESWCAGTMLCSGVVDNAAVCIVVARKRTVAHILSLIHISEPTRQAEISYAVLMVSLTGIALSLIHI